MKLKFKKWRLTKIGYGLDDKVDKLNDEITIDLSHSTVQETINGKITNQLWPYTDIIPTHIKDIYQLSVPNEKTRLRKEVSGYRNDWNFKLTGMKKLIINYYKYKKYIGNIIINGIKSFLS